MLHKQLGIPRRLEDRHARLSPSRAFRGRVSCAPRHLCQLGDGVTRGRKCRRVVWVRTPPIASTRRPMPSSMMLWCKMGCVRGCGVAWASGLPLPTSWSCARHNKVPISAVWHAATQHRRLFLQIQYSISKLFSGGPSCAERHRPPQHQRVTKSVWFSASNSSKKRRQREIAVQKQLSLYCREREGCREREKESAEQKVLAKSDERRKRRIMWLCLCVMPVG